VIFDGREDFEGAKLWLAENTNPDRRMGDVQAALQGADVFLGVSGPGIVTPADIATMNRNPIVFALANPTPEVMPDDIQEIAAVIATGRSDFPNQINNVLCFPGIFRGALDARAMAISEGMKLAAADAISAAVSESDLSPSYIIPSVFNRSVAQAVAEAVAREAQREGIVRHEI
jgi:malate dehydrogenase (oxaloacetate-decarboxylating)